MAAKSKPAKNVSNDINDTINSNTISTYSINKEVLNTYTNISDKTINAMIQQLDYGNFDEAVKVKNKLLQDDRLAAVLNSREFNLLDSSISVISNSKTPESDKIDIDIIQAALNFAEQEIKVWYGNILLLGAGLLQIIYSELVNGKRSIKLQNYEPYGLRYDIKEDLYFLITSYKDQSDEERLKRINELKSAGGYISLAQYQKNYDVEIITGNPKWIIGELGSKGFRNGLIRSLAWTYYNKQLAIVNKNKWATKTAGVIKKLMVPAQSDPTANKAFSRSIKNMEVDDVILLPQTSDGPNYDVSYLEAANGGTGYQVYQDTIDNANTDYAIAILSNNLTTEVTSGSNASTVTHREKEYKLAKSDKQFVQAILNNYLIPSYQMVNSPELDAEVIINLDTTQEIRAQLDLLQTINNANLNIKADGIKIDMQDLIGNLGISWIKFDDGKTNI